MAPRPRARFGGSAHNAAIANSAKTPDRAGLGDCGLLPPTNPGWRGHLRMAANERREDLTLDRRRLRSRGGCCAAYHVGEAYLSAWECGARHTSSCDGSG